MFRSLLEIISYDLLIYI